MEEDAVTFSLAPLIENRLGEQYTLHRQYLNSSLARVQAIIGDEEVKAIIASFDAVMAEAMRVRGRVWGLSRQLKYAVSQ